MRLITGELKYRKSMVADVIKRYKETLTVERKPGSGRRRGFQSEPVSNRVVKTVKRKPNTSIRELSSKRGLSATWVREVLAIRNLQGFRVQKSVNRTAQQDQRTKTRSGRLYDWFLHNKKMCVVMDDETYVVVDFKQLPGRSFYRVIRRFAVAHQFKYHSLKKSPKRIWLGRLSALATR